MSNGVVTQPSTLLSQIVSAVFTWAGLSTAGSFAADVNIVLDPFMIWELSLMIFSGVHFLFNHTSVALKIPLKIMTVYGSLAFRHSTHPSQGFGSRSNFGHKKK
mmetsp:Transcript_48239/g.92203  ORF Transcript_48239/g.92203 Transcript_48239/m.92203 type:complete len:104 (-) Transcript_48239:643-954(-)